MGARRDGKPYEFNPAGRYTVSRQRLVMEATLVVVVRCDACGNLFEDQLGELSPCPHCHKFARGAAA